MTVIHHGVVLITTVPDTIRSLFVLVHPVVGSDVCNAVFVATRAAVASPPLSADT